MDILCKIHTQGLKLRGKVVFFGSLDLIRLFHKCLFFVALGTGGFGPLAPRASGQPPLFLLCIPCIWTIEGPGLDTYPGIIFFIFVLGMNPASTCCGLFCHQNYAFLTLEYGFFPQNVDTFNKIFTSLPVLVE